MGAAVAMAIFLQATGGAWSTSEKTSELDHSTNYVAVLESPTVVPDVLAQPAHPKLTVSCSHDGLFASVDWPDFLDLAGENKTPVEWKLDGGKVMRSSWYSSVQSVGPMGGGAQAWLKQLASAKRLVVRVQAQRGDGEATFDLAGTDAIVAKLSTLRCG